MATIYPGPITSRRTDALVVGCGYPESLKKTGTRTPRIWSIQMAVTVRRGSTETAFIRFSLPGDGPPGSVSVVGSFNDWTPGAHEMREDDDGGRSVTIEVRYGDEVHFRYLAEAGRWFDDAGTPTDTDGGVVMAVEEDEAERVEQREDLADRGFDYDDESATPDVVVLTDDPAAGIRVADRAGREQSSSTE